MSFKNLENRFYENVRTLYRTSPQKFENGKVTNNQTAEPYIVTDLRRAYTLGPVVRPTGNIGYFNSTESRSLPIQSARRDTQRLSLFLRSPNGTRFLAKQRLLQTGNTFKFTRVLNPAFITGNVSVPFSHVKRNLRPFSELFSKTDTSYENVKKMGTMQTESYDKLKKWKQPRFIQEHLGRIKNNKQSLLRTIGGAIVDALKTTISNKLARAFSPVVSTVSALNPLQKRNIGEEKNWAESRPELVKDSVVKSVELANIDYQLQMRKFFSEELGESEVKFIKYFDTLEGIAKPHDRNDSNLKTVQGNRAEAVKRSRNQDATKISYIKDPANKESTNKINQLAYQPAYAPINSNFDDPIVVSFAMGNHPPVRFRAFLTNLNETSTPTYQTLQYIGRIEKFVNYSGVQREASFKLSLLAFSKDELDYVWRRINFLTGLTFPYGFTRGIMQPNIVRLTLGGVYTDQPGYISSLNTNFQELTESWDISKDKQVPIGATVDIRFTIIEKATRVADSPFYGITDGDRRQNKTPMRGFSKEISIPINQQLFRNNPAIPPTKPTTGDVIAQNLLNILTRPGIEKLQSIPPIRIGNNPNSFLNKTINFTQNTFNQINQQNNNTNLGVRPSTFQTFATTAISNFLTRNRRPTPP